MDAPPYEWVIWALLGFVGLLGAFTTFVNAWKGWKALREPHDKQDQRLADHDQKLINDHEQINEMNEDLKEIRAWLRVDVENQIEIMEHIVSGDHIDRLAKRLEFTRHYLYEELER